MTKSDVENSYFRSKRIGTMNRDELLEVIGSLHSESRWWVQQAKDNLEFARTSQKFKTSWWHKVGL
jgi:hypothetical protein